MKKSLAVILSLAMLLTVISFAVLTASAADESVQKHKVSYYVHSDDEEPLFEEEYAEGESFFETDASGMISGFRGWTTTPDSWNTLVQYPVTMGSDDLAFYAYTGPFSVYIARFVNENDELIAQSRFVPDSPGFTIAVPETEKTGYEFDCWYIANTGEKVYGWDTVFSSGYDDNLTVISVYNPLQFTVTVNLNGGEFPADYTGGNSFRLDYNSQIVAPAFVPLKDGYKFIGWSRKENPRAAEDNLGKVPASNDTVIYAVWRCLHVNLKEVPKVESTCVVQGVAKYYICEECGSVFDENKYGVGGSVRIFVYDLADHTDADNDGICDNCGVIYKFFTFGSYPQSKVTDNETLSVLGSYLPVLSWTDGINGIEYADIELGGEKYRAVTTGAAVDFYKFEPLVWRVLDEKTGFVICDNFIDLHYYDNDSDVWADSDLRTFMNGRMFDIMFTGEEKAVIREPKRSDVSPADYLLLLNIDEIIGGYYNIGTNGSRIAAASDYAISQSNKIIDGWWLNSTGTDGAKVHINSSGEGRMAFDTPTDLLYGVRPAMYIDPESEIFRTIHSFGEPEYIWTGADSCVAEFKCTDCGYTAAIDGEISREVTVPAGKYTDGSENDTATFIFGGETYTSTAENVIPQTAEKLDARAAGILEIVAKLILLLYNAFSGLFS